MALTPEQFEKLKQLALEKKQESRGFKIEPINKSGFVAAIRDIPSDIGETVAGVGETISKLEERELGIDKSIEEGKTGRLRGFLQKVGLEVGAGFSAVGDIAIGAAKLFTSPRTEEAIKGTIQRGAQAAIETEPVQKLIEKYQNLTPEQQTDIDAALGITEGLTTFFGLGPVTKVFKQTAKLGIEGVLKLKRGLIRNATPQAVKNLQNRLKPKDLKSATDIMVDAYQKSFVADNVSINKKLDALARAQSFKDKKVTSSDLIRNLVETGVFPTVEGKLAKFDDIIENIVFRQNRLAENRIPVLRTVAETTSIVSLKKQALESLRKSPQIVENLLQSEKQLDTLFKNFEAKFGKNLTAEDIGGIQIAMNSRTKAFGEEVFLQDVANIIASTARRRIDELEKKRFP